MRALERRLRLLEATAEARSKPLPQPGDVDLSRAAAALFDLLEVHYPDQGWVGTAHLTSIRQAEAAAARIVAGAPSEVDEKAIAAFDASDAIKVFSFTGREYLAWFA